MMDDFVRWGGTDAVKESGNERSVTRHRSAVEYVRMEMEGAESTETEGGSGEQRRRAEREIGRYCIVSSCRCRGAGGKD